MRRLRLLGVLAAVVLAAAACGGSSDDASTAGTEPGGLVGLVRDEPLAVGDVSLPEVTDDPDGVPFAFRAAPGELLVGYFGYTSCPDVCPTTLANLRNATAALGEPGARVSVAMATVDPDRDTPERLTGYLRSFADDVHALRTTDRAQLEAAEDRFGAQSQVDVTPEGKVEVQHTGTAYVIDDQGRVLVEWPFGVSAEDMQNDLAILLERSGNPA